MSIRILIADDHSVIRTGLRALLKSDPSIEVVGDAADGKETLRLVEEARAEIVLLDISMPGEDGMAIARRLKAKHPDVKVLFLTMHEDEALLREALKAGAAGYVIKRAEDSDIIAAIHAVQRGDVYVHPAMTRALLHSSSDHQRVVAPAGEPLTRREVEVLRMLARGYTNRQIAESLELSVRTVEGHRANLMGKLGVSSRVELVEFAEDHGLI